MLRPSRLALAVLATLAILTARPLAAAAAAIDFVPFVGVLQPVESQVNDGSFPIVFEIGSAAAYGARAGWWFNNRFGLEASVTTAGTDLTISGGGGILTSSGTWLATDARARVRLMGGDSPMALDLLGGVGYTTTYWGLDDILAEAGLDTESRVTWILGLGTTVPVGSLGLRFEFEDHIHDSNFEADQTVTAIQVDDRTQHDLVFSLGLVVPLKGR